MATSGKGQPTRGRSAEEIAALMKSYEESGQTQREYCRQRGIAFSTFDYYRYRWRKPKPARAAAAEPQREPRLIEVKVAAGNLTTGKPSARAGMVTVILREDRRIEIPSGFADEELLARLVRIVERA